ncbi:hypothetical protein [Gottfriedia solisilvae]|uniref:hypothetical protein n=1 Tax=Gottfriedia solisilvae TaxID=1516104 RepID=UPI003D2F2822
MTNNNQVIVESLVEKISRVNFYLEHEEMDFVAYEFELEEEVLIEESGCEQYLFRLDVNKETGEMIVYCAYSQDFDIMEEATYYFDTEKILEDIKKYLAENEDIGNQGQAYVKYCKLRDEGYDCDYAISMCYQD